MTDPKPKRIFVSSTVSDLLAFREAAKEVIAWAGYEAELVGPLTGLSQAEVISRCRQLVSGCDLCVLIAGERSGGRIDCHSFTSHEIEAADVAGVPILAFMVEMGEGSQTKFLPEIGLEESVWVERFRNRQKAERPIDRVMHVANTAIGEFRQILYERLCHFPGRP